MPAPAIVIVRGTAFGGRGILPRPGDGVAGRGAYHAPWSWGLPELVQAYRGSGSIVRVDSKVRRWFCFRFTLLDSHPPFHTQPDAAG